MRKFFVKICKSNTSVFYEKSNSGILVSFEQPKGNQVNRLVFDNGGVVLEKNGFDNEGFEYCKKFYMNNFGHIQELAEQNI